jgi:NifB/MoaA-like Fe-S oxidoreductase
MPSGKVSLVTGMLGERFVGPMAAKLDRLPGLSVDVIPVRNDFLGHGITVSGLLAGEDILKTLQNASLESDRVILPPNCVNHEGLFLDDLCPSDLSKTLGRPVEVGTYSLLDSILMPEDRSVSVPGSSVDHPYIASHQNP